MQLQSVFNSKRGEIVQLVAIQCNSNLNCKVRKAIKRV